MSTTKPGKVNSWTGEIWECGVRHKFCKSRIAARRSHGMNSTGGVAVIVLKQIDNEGDSTHWILLGKQRGGQYAGLYSIVHGKMDPEDNFCYITSAMRELDEEFKIRINPGKQFQKYFRDPRTKQPNYIQMEGTVVFVSDSIPVDIDRINAKLAEYNDDNSEETWHLREVTEVRWFPLDEINTDSKNSKNGEISSFALAAIRKLRQKK